MVLKVVCVGNDSRFCNITFLPSG